MTTPTTRRRRFPAALAIVAALSTFPAFLHQSPAHASGQRRSSISSTVCDYDWQSGTWAVKQMIKCSARRWHVSGGPDKALRVARCESHFHPKAYNSGGYGGVFQQSTHYWPKRAQTFGFPDWSVYNGRANVMVSIRMAHRYGWGGWSCA